MAKYLDYAGLQELVVKLKAYVEGAISEIDMDLFVVVDTLPATGEANRIYLVPGEVTETDNIYVEYGWVNGAWEKLGEVKLDTDLSNFYTKDEVDQLIKDVEAGELKSLEDYVTKEDAETTKSKLEKEIAGKQDTLTAGKNISITDNTVACTLENVSELTNDAGYITSAVLDDYAKTEDIPTKVSELDNDSGYIKESDMEAITNDEIDALFE